MGQGRSRAYGGGTARAHTRASDDGDKVLHPPPLAELLLGEGSTVAVIVHPHGEVQRVGDGGADVHGAPLLDQLGGVEDDPIVGIHPATG